LLELIDVAAEKNEHKKADQLTNIHENRIRNDPFSTDVSIPESRSDHNDGSARQYLIVPYHDKDLAKTAGAR